MMMESRKDLHASRRAAQSKVMLGDVSVFEGESVEVEESACLK